MARRNALELSAMTPGKLLGMQRITHSNGTLALLALDRERDIARQLQAALARRGEAREVTHDEVVDATLTLTHALARKGSGVVLGPSCGAWHAVCAFKLPPHTGLVVRLESHDTERTPDGSGRVSMIDPSWGVAKIKRLGADAVKLRVPYEPEHAASAQRQRDVVEHVAAECDRHDIVLVLSVYGYPLDGEHVTSPPYLERRPRTTIESARHLSGLGDVYVAELPGTRGRDSHERLTRSLGELDEACRRPWALRDGDADFAACETELGLALEHGATGSLMGQAVWEPFADGDEAARGEFLRAEGPRRLGLVGRLAKRGGRPWFKKYRLTRGRFARVRIPQDWHRDYPDGAPTAPLVTPDGA